MHIVVVGLNYRTAPVEVRERFTIAQERLPAAVRELKNRRGVLECVIVATCNRTELYAVIDRDTHCPRPIRSFMDEWFGEGKESYGAYLYQYEDEQAKKHLFRVACGLDSMIIGETQILGQVRDAFLMAQSIGATGIIFNTLFKSAITVAKRAHAETGIDGNAVSVSYAAVELGKRIFATYEGKSVLIIGAGKTGELTLKHLAAAGAERVAVVNRTAHRASKVAEKFGGQAYGMERLPELLAEADVVISSTGSDGVILTKRTVGEVMRFRPSRPMLMIDIAVPRDIDPAVRRLEGVHLYDIDDLEGVVESNLESRRSQTGAIEAMIREELDAFDTWYRSLGVGPVIRALQDKARTIHLETMDSLRNKLPDLTERELDVIHKLTKSMLNQMMHEPIRRVKEMAPGADGSEALEYFTKLFALEDRLEESDRSAPQAAAASFEKAEERVVPLRRGALNLA